ncbi:hypothetical protein Celly_0362 [Cellulophaga lytica DSM 7489]|uniref:Uncharacterized protein n=1 Tax=Cellulophaga lytica (strain ATCC 23178 / DSM 7489 / JCM 8516 / NBRC 14961 / NCIMB 1423 / VKM B-1433 / Cy l20) TaxID=867900 RepID=F0RI71_CELLC|nr:hypothetical protein [Cellulophaga lytica]ADY28197.1 hypothetical protein Celly_0362 [Cellulophaga lytica DSM 7489]WQG77621.1 hypothetical protein SR888_01560 [Cellulophaga lytica]
MKEEFTEKGSEKQKALIGDFIIRFESLNDWIRFILPNIIFKKQITELELKNIETLMTDLGAEQLRTKFDSLIFDNFSSFPELSKTNNKLSNKVSELTSIRNSIAHGTYRLGWKDFKAELSDDTFSLRHSKSTKRGYKKRSKIISTKDLIELNELLEKLAFCYKLIHIIIRNLSNHNRIDLAEKNLHALVKKIDEIDKINLKHLDVLN